MCSFNSSGARPIHVKSTTRHGWREDRVLPPEALKTMNTSLSTTKTVLSAPRCLVGEWFFPVFGVCVVCLFDLLTCCFSCLICDSLFDVFGYCVIGHAAMLNLTRLSIMFVNQTTSQRDDERAAQTNDDLRCAQAGVHNHVTRRQLNISKPRCLYMNVFLSITSTFSIYRMDWMVGSISIMGCVSFCVSLQNRFCFGSHGPPVSLRPFHGTTEWEMTRFNWS